MFLSLFSPLISILFSYIYTFVKNTNLNMNKLLKLLGFYLLSVLIFSCIYWSQFRKNTSAFIIEKQMNEITNNIYKMPYDNLIYKTPDYKIPFNINDFNNILKSKFDSISMLAFKLDSINNYEKSVKELRDSLQNRVEKSITSNIDLLIAQETKDLINQKDSILKIIDFLITKKENPNIDVAIVNEQVKIAYIKLKIASIELDIRNVALRNNSLFADKELALKHDSLQSEYLTNSDSISIYSNSLKILNREIYTLTKKYHANRIEKVSYWDFLYFSILASTSNNFGDMTPNSKNIKIAICFQILFSILFIGVLVDHIIKSINRRNW